ncbi:hypothetical protein O3P69_010623 [Scylla paramamosain]|uniref:Uncharacterized protein n=1 Tax=Scylla paramamosain TaxID=85552 RepID=A0AAW0THC0_SCYPA
MQSGTVKLTCTNIPCTCDKLHKVNEMKSCATLKTDNNISFEELGPSRGRKWKKNIVLLGIPDHQESLDGATSHEAKVEVLEMVGTDAELCAVRRLQQRLVTMPDTGHLGFSG